MAVDATPADETGLVAGGVTPSPLTQRWRVRLQSLGCRLNEAELEEWAERFQQQGLRVVGDEEAADLVVVNTCAVTQEAVRKSRQILRRSQRRNPGARLIVSGCLATLERESMAREAGVDLVVANPDKDRLVEVALDTLEVPAMPELALSSLANPLFTRGRHRAFVKVQDGCRYQCTFCITTQARGEERSRPVAQVVETVNRLGQSGIHEVVLTGVHLGGYGSDSSGGQDGSLTGLIAAILAETDMPRVRLGSLEPWDLPDRFWGLFENPRLMPHLHLPLQSGSDAVLRRMARRCKTQDFDRLVETGRAAVPGLNVTTDIIVGFPGERVGDWQRTLAFTETMRFGHVHLFSYSPRAGTLAASLPDQVSPRIKRERCQELQALAVRMKLEVMRTQVGKRIQVLVEGSGEGAGGQIWSAYTPNYLPVRVTGDDPRVAANRLVEVILTGVDANGCVLSGRPADPFRS